MKSMRELVRDANPRLMASLSEVVKDAKTQIGEEGGRGKKAPEHEPGQGQAPTTFYALGTSLIPAWAKGICEECRRPYRNQSQYKLCHQCKGKLCRGGRCAGIHHAMHLAAVMKALNEGAA